MSAILLVEDDEKIRDKFELCCYHLNLELLNSRIADDVWELIQKHPRVSTIFMTGSLCTSGVWNLFDPIDIVRATRRWCPQKRVFTHAHRNRKELIEAGAEPGIIFKDEWSPMGHELEVFLAQFKR